MTSRRGTHLELRPFSGSTLTDVLNYLKRDVSKAFADAFAILAKPTPFAASDVTATWDITPPVEDTWHDSDTQLSLDSGRWLIFTTGMATGFWTVGADSVNLLHAAIRAGDSVYSEGQIGVFGANSAAAGYLASFNISPVALSAVIDVGEPKVFKISLKVSSGGAGGFAADYIYLINGRLTAVRL